MPSVVHDNNTQNTWDVPITDNRFQNGYVSPEVRSVKSVSSNITKRTRPHVGERRNKTIKTLKLKRHPEVGFGFSIRGGVEHGTGIFISSLHQYSDAYSQGLQVGDQILRANKIYFNEISHEQAFYYIQSLRSVVLVVLSLGVVPGSSVAYSEYQWIDCYGRPCSPLQVTYPIRNDALNDSNGSNISRYLEAEDERKVNIVVGDKLKLGLLIRGGSEYGLGIFVAGIDEDSVADRSGIMVGEQILEVNGIDFIDITHADAAHIIRTSKMMTMILKDVEKIPLARIIYDDHEAAWKDKGNHQRSRVKKEESVPKPPPDQNKRSPTKRNIEILSKDAPPVFQAGIAGSQLQHNAASNPMSYRWIEEKAQKCLTDEEWSTLKYYLREYVHENITINGLVLSLFDLLDSSEKMRLLMEVRGVVRAHDIDTFDEMVLKKQVDNIEIENESYSRDDEEHVEAIEEFVSKSNPPNAKNNKMKTLGRRMKKMGLIDENQDLDEQMFDSLVNNIRKESEEELPSSSAREQYLLARAANNANMQNGYNSSDEDESPTYATIKRKPKSILRGRSSVRNSYSDTDNYQSPLRGIENISDVTNEALQEEANNLADALEQYNDISDDDDDVGNESDEGDYNVAGNHNGSLNNSYDENEDDASDYQRVNEDDESATDDYQDVQNQSHSSVSSSSNSSHSADYERNKLGYAFNFLANENGEEQSEKSNDSDKSSESENLNTSLESNHSQLFEEIRNNSLKKRSAMKTLIKSQPKEKPLRNFIKRNSFENPAKLSPRSSQGKIKIKKRVSVTPPTKEPDEESLQEDSDSNKSSRFFRDLQSAGRSGNFVENYQPKSLSRSNEDEVYFDPIKPVEEVKTEAAAPQILIENSHSPPQRSFAENRNVFDATPSVEHRMSNFSVNDILRQNYLPTTRVEYDPNESVSENSTQNNSFDNQQVARNRTLSRLSSLHIQNQYQYEKKVEKVQHPEPIKLIIENITQEPTENLYMDPLRPSMQLRKNSFEGDKKRALAELREKYREKAAQKEDVVDTKVQFNDSKNTSFFDYRNMSFNASNESLSKFIDEPKTYGKPVMTKSPRPEFTEPVNFDSLRRKETERLSASDENNFYDLSSLKRNSNSKKIKAEVLKEMINKTKKQMQLESEEESVDTNALLRQKIEQELARRLSINEEKTKESIKFIRLRQNFEQDTPLVSNDVNETSISKRIEKFSKLKQDLNVSNSKETASTNMTSTIGEELLKTLNQSEDNKPIIEDSPIKIKTSPRGNLIKSRIQAFSQSNENLDENVSPPKSPIHIPQRSPLRIPSKRLVNIPPKNPFDIPPKSPFKIALKNSVNILPKSPVRVLPKSPVHIFPKSTAYIPPRSPVRNMSKSPTHITPKSPNRKQAWQTSALGNWERADVQIPEEFPTYENVGNITKSESPTRLPQKLAINKDNWRNSPLGNWEQEEIRENSPSIETLDDVLPKTPTRTKSWRSLPLGNWERDDIRENSQSIETPEYVLPKTPTRIQSWRNSPLGNWERTDPSGLLEKDVELPRNRDDPGFKVDVRTRFKSTEVYIAQIQNKELEKLIAIGDTILAIGGNPLRKAVKKGLANIMIKTAFNSSTEPTILLKLKTRYLK